MSTQHTPGPWSVYEHDPLVIVNAEGSSLGIAEPGDPFIGADEAKANALVWAASAELLVALQPFVGRNSSEDTITLVVRTADITRARAAIAKATGSAS